MKNSQYSTLIFCICITLIIVLTNTFKCYCLRIHSGNCRKSLTLFSKNFVKSMALLKKLLNSWFDEFFFSKREFLVFPHCGIIQKDHFMFICKSWNILQNHYRKYFVKSSLWKLLSRNIFQVWRVKLLLFHNVSRLIISPAIQIIREINFDKFSPKSKDDCKNLQWYLSCYNDKVQKNILWHFEGKFAVLVLKHCK